MIRESYTLVPSVIAAKAHRLADAGLYEQALELLERNCVIAEVYPTRVEMLVPRPPINKRGFQKNGNGHKAAHK